MPGSPERHAADPRLPPLFAGALRLPGAERMAFLASQCRDDPELVASVAALLDSHDRAPAFLADPWSEPRAAPRLQQVGPYRVIEAIGEGASGVVYRAEQAQPRREVALKVLAAGGLLDDARRRFRREADLLARLQHPGIAQVFDAGVLDTDVGEIAWFAMEFVHGRRLDEAMRGRGAATIGEVLAKVADAVQHAHERGIVHRDLKPANVLVANGEPAQPKVLDFGIARSLAPGDAAAQTMTGIVVGTLGYMSPEQVRAGDVGPPADVYALGVITFELLTGQPPIDTRDLPIGEAMRRIADDEPPPLRELRPDLDHDLGTVITTALQKDPERRYPTAGAFAADLRRALRHEPIAARLPTAGYRLRKFVQRHRALVTATAGAFAILLAATIAVAWLAVKNAALASDERQARADLDARQRALRHRTYGLEMVLALEAARSPTGLGRVADAIARWRPAAGEPPEHDLRGFEWHLLSAIGRDVARVVPTPNVAYCVRWRPDGGRLLLGGKGFVNVVDFPSLAPVRDLVTGGHNYALAWRADGAAFASAPGTLVTVDAATLATRTLLEVPDKTMQAVAYTDAGRRLVAFDYRGASWTIDADTGAIAAHRSDFGSRLAEPQPGGVLVATQHGLVHPDDLRVRVRYPNDAEAHGARWSRDGALLAISRGKVTILRANGELVATHAEPADVQTMAWSRNADHLALMRGNGAVEIRAAGSWELLRAIANPHTSWNADGLSIDWSPDGRWLACCRRANEVTLVDLARSSHVRSVVPAQGQLQIWPRVQWHPTARRLAVSLRANTRFVDPDTGAGDDDRRQGWLRLVAPDGEHFLYHDRGEVVVVGGDGRELRRAFKPPPELGRDTLRLAWLGNDRVLAACDRELWLWPLAGEPTLLCTHASTIHTVAAAPDARTACFAGDERLVRIAADGTVIAEVPVEHATIALAWSPDGALIAASSHARHVHLHDARTLAVVRALTGLEDQAVGIAWQPGGRRVGAAARGGVCLWEPTTGDLTARLTDCAGAAHLDFAPAGDELAVIDAMGRVVVYDARTAR